MRRTLCFHLWSRKTPPAQGNLSRAHSHPPCAPKSANQPLRPRIAATGTRAPRARARSKRRLRGEPSAHRARGPPVRGSGAPVRPE
ncbi:unnamed protein product [Rangifer tarandus platyrhynchus]|uniref:Uncharacterized protein n=2 Tax=Rangifer tarandus platyrhynchus TaxID=3082113 RepID=A0ABN8YTQ3_RANTA|nr:unnamed protein product [Rangifer tarandus platyrhynchus]CAI9702451.1 unnamed protein product [Rangifer tarandus platyrhynchus]